MVAFGMLADEGGRRERERKREGEVTHQGMEMFG